MNDTASVLRSEGALPIDDLPCTMAARSLLVTRDNGGKAPDVVELIRPIDEALRDWGADEIQALGSREYDIAANWKLAAEYFFDGCGLPDRPVGAMGPVNGAISANLVGTYACSGSEHKTIDKIKRRGICR
jgi:hypothetical protein